MVLQDGAADAVTKEALLVGVVIFGMDLMLGFHRKEKRNGE